MLSFFFNSKLKTRIEEKIPTFISLTIPQLFVWCVCVCLAIYVYMYACTHERLSKKTFSLSWDSVSKFESYFVLQIRGRLNKHKE